MNCRFPKVAVRVFSGIVTVLSLVTIVSATSPSSATRWKTDFDRAEFESTSTNRPMLIHFYAEWCGPCHRMDREVLSSPELARQLGSNFVAVRIDVDKNPQVAKRFGIESLPTEVFVDPDGRVLSRTSGYLSKRKYLAQVARIEAKWKQSQMTMVAKKKASSNRPANLARVPYTFESQKPMSAAMRPIRPVQTFARNLRPVPRSPNAIPGVPQRVEREGTVGLGGFSPVSLWSHRKWVRGQKRFSVSYKGIVYRMASASDLERFRANPDRFAPKLLGCDPVVLWKTDRAVAGSAEFAAYFEGELYLFVDASSRAQFREVPVRYVRTRHVLKIDKIEKTDGATVVR